MTTSGITAYVVDADSLINDVLYTIEALEELETRTPEHESAAIGAINTVLKSWQSFGGHRWLKEDASFELTGAQCYRFTHDDTTTHPAGRGKVYGSGNAEILGPFPPGVANVTSLRFSRDDTDDRVPAVGEQIGMLTTNGLFTARITAVAPFATDEHTLTLDASYDPSTVLATVPVLFGAYVDGFVRMPFRIRHARRSVEVQGAEVPVQVVGRKRYYEQVNKSQANQVTMIHYHRDKDYGELLVWGVGQAGHYLHINYERPIEMITDTAQDVDIPPEFRAALVYAAAEYLMPQYALPRDKRMEIRNSAANYLQIALDGDDDSGSLNIGLTTRWS